MWTVNNQNTLFNPKNQHLIRESVKRISDTLVINTQLVNIRKKRVKVNHQM